MKFSNFVYVCVRVREPVGRELNERKSSKRNKRGARAWCVVVENGVMRAEEENDEPPPNYENERRQFGGLPHELLRLGEYMLSVTGGKREMPRSLT